MESTVVSTLEAIPLSSPALSSPEAPSYDLVNV
jgi:hypothetical protein